MFRSGSTLLCKMLSAHPRVTLATDPYYPFFKQVCAHHARALGQTYDPEGPLPDYYFDPLLQPLFRAIQDGSLAEPADPADLPGTRNRIDRWGRPYAPRLMDHLDKVGGATFQDVFASMLALVAEQYGSPGDAWTGFKDVWSDEFIPAMARSFPEAKFLEIVRDPRAVCASRNDRPPYYPWLFMCRQWRKLVALAWEYQQPAHELADRVLLLRYEDLVDDPEGHARRLCDFLEIDFAASMLDPAGFTDGSGQAWSQNTRYGDGARSFDSTPLQRWRKVLSEDQVALIDALCAPEMALHGYQPDACPDGIPAQMQLAGPHLPLDELGPWIRSVTRNDPLTNAVEMAKEALRYELLAAANLSAVSDEVIEGAFLSRGVLDAARQARAGVAVS
jgi:sulfotransferase family protein